MRQAESRKKKTGIPFWIWAAVGGALLIAAAIGWVTAHVDDPGPRGTSSATLPVIGRQESTQSGSSASASASRAGQKELPTLPSVFVIGSRQAGTPDGTEPDTKNPPETLLPQTEAETSASLTEEQTTAVQTAEETTAPPTEPPTTQAPTEPPTEPPTTQAPTQPPTTAPTTTQAPTTQAPTVPPTTEAPTTEAPTTEAPTTEAPTAPPPATETRSETASEETLPEEDGIRVWIGDSRMTGVRLYVTWDAETDDFIDQVGEGIGWFQLTAIPKLKERIAAENVTKVYINMGVNDCAATYKQDRGTRAEAYSNLINALVDEYPEIRFFFCSVGPSNGEWYNTVEIAKLNEEVDLFNAEMAELCRATYIDSGEYLKRSGFATSDGIHYNIPTYQRWYEYVLSQSQ